MENTDGANELDKSSASESQQKMFDISFGVFFDVHDIDSWMTTAGNYRKKGERFKNDMENKVQDNEYYKIAQFVEGTASKIAEQFPNNPVSKAIKTGLDAKDKVVGYKDKAEGLVGSVTGTVDNLSNKVLDNDKVKLDGIDPLGSKRSIISLMEPVYCGKIQELEGFGEMFGTYAHRVYAQGSVYAPELKEKKSDEEDKEELSEAEKAQNEQNKKNFRSDLANAAANDAFNDINDKLRGTPQGKISVHFDMFGYANDDSMNILETKLNELKSTFSNINELNVDYKGQYTKFNDPDEVKSSLKDTAQRFKNTKFLEK